MRMTKRGPCEPCGTDWKAKINELWQKYQNVVKTVQVNGTHYYPDGNGNVSINLSEDGLTKSIEVNGTRYYPDENGNIAFDVDTQVIDKGSYFTLLCDIEDSDISTLINDGNDWILTSNGLVQKSGYFDLSDIGNLIITDSTNYYELTV